MDVLFDSILSIGMKPFVELGFMPSALASGTQTIFWWRGNVTPPKDYRKWAGLIRALTQHVTDRYGPEEIRTWYFEVWNEPNLSGFWSGTQEEYFMLYRSSVEAIKSVNKAYRVGGPATAGEAAQSMSCWTFTDIFEEPGPRTTPFHGGFGLINYEGINKPAFYAFAYLNKLGGTELVNPDSASWACRTTNGDMQMLFWDFTNTHPGDSVNDQVYYLRDLPSKQKGKVRIELTGLPAGTYQWELSQIGYRVNDAYSSYLTMGSPGQLTRAQVEAIKAMNDGSPVKQERITVDAKGVLTKLLDLRENDVFLVRLIRS